jgi:hypothetical protein
VAATVKNVKSMLKSRKLQARRSRAFMVDAQGFDGRQVSPVAKRAAKTKNYTLARRLLDKYCLTD